MTADQLQAIRDRLAALRDAPNAYAKHDALQAIRDHADDDLDALLAAYLQLVERVHVVVADIRDCANRRQTVLQAAPSTTGGQSCGPVDYPLRDATRHTLRSVEWWATALDENVKHLTCLSTRFDF